MSEQITALAKVMTADTEIIELIIEELTEEVNNELEEVCQRLQKLEEREWTHEEVKHLIPKKAQKPPTYELFNSGGKWQFCLADEYTYANDDRIPVKVTDPLVKDWIAEVKELTDRKYALQAQKTKLDGNKRLLKANIMKRVLEGTAEGRNVLEQISQLKVTLRKQLGKQ